MKLKRILALVLCLALLCSFAVRAEGLDQDAESVGEIESVVETVSEETVEGETAGVSGTQLATDETSPAFDVTHDGSDDVLLSPNATTGTGNTWQGSIIEEDTVLELAGNAVVSLREPDNTNDRAGNFVVMSGVTLTLKGYGSFVRNVDNLDIPLVYVEAGGTLIIQGNSEDQHLTIDGKGIIANAPLIVSHGTVELEYATIQNGKNRANNSVGGGIRIHQTGSLTMNYSTVSYNTARVSGGGIHSVGPVTIKNSLFEYNRAMETETGVNSNGGFQVNHGRGGALYLAGYSTSTNNVTTNHEVSSTINNSIFRYNASMFYGGAMQVCAYAKLTFESGEIYENESVLKGAGAIHVTNSAKFIFNGGKIYSNRAREVGGAIHSSYECELKFNGGEIYNNIVYGKGGGVNVNTGGDIVLNGTKIENNKAYTGAYYTQATVSADGDKWSINTDNSTLHPNTSFVGKGGGLQLDFATCTLNAGSISDNYADKYGGGISLSMERVNYNENFKYCKTVKFTVNGGEVLRNSTAGHGGAAYLGKNIFNTMTLEEFMNKVFDRGNGQPSGPTEEEIVLFQSLQNTKPTYTATGGTISHNTANGDGGAVYIETGNAVISGGSMSDNSASMNGGAVYISGDVTMTGGQVTDNTATNGGGVYVTDGNFTMISGTMTDNKAIERTSGQAEAGNEGYGGAILVNDGMLIIGLENCDGYGENGSIHDHNGTNVPSEYADLDHPVLQSNVAAFGGGIAVKGGNAYIYCGQIDGNTSNSPGTGMNIFMDGGELYQDYDATIIGSPKDQGVVNVGGKLTIGHGNGALSIDIVYHSNYSVDLLWKGVAPDGYYLNLPYCPKGWSDDQKEKALVFVGWSQDKNYDAQTVRAKDDYHPIGYPFEIKDMDGDDNDTKTIHFYAIWAPFVNKIAYQYCYDGENVLAMEDTMKPNGAPQSYQFELSPGSIDVASPSKAGYTFVGWMLYASTDDIANWDADPVVYPATLKTHLPERTTIAQTSLLFMPTNGTTSIPTEQNFGVITLVAIFTPAYTSLTVTKVVDENNTGSDENQTFLFRIVGTPDDGGAKIDMTIAIVGAGSVTIEHLPVGTYTITEITDWSWRYDTVKAADDSNAQATVSNVIVMELKDPELTYTCKFINTRTEEKWLSGDSILRNWWGNLTATNTEGG